MKKLLAGAATLFLATGAAHQSASAKVDCLRQMGEMGFDRKQSKRFCNPNNYVKPPRLGWGCEQGNGPLMKAIIFSKYPVTAAQHNSDINRDKHELNIGSASAMRWHTSSASSSRAGIADDIVRLIPLNERAAFREMLEIELHGRELSDHEKRRAAERIWHRFLIYGWPV